MIIEAGGEITLGAAKYLNVFSANRAFAISSKDEGLAKTTVKAGFSYDLEGYRLVTFHNDGIDDLNAEFEMSTLRILTGSSSGVEIVNEPWLMGFRNPIAVTAEATVENGTMHVLAASSLADIADININANSAKDILVANADRKSALIQVISATKTPVRIGGATVASGRGIYASGSLANPAIIPISAKGLIRIYNDSNEQATISVTELLT